MKATKLWMRPDTMGVFFEVYAPESTATVPISIELERDRGWLARVGEAIGIGGDSPVNTAWVQPGSGGLYPVSFTIDLREVEAGDYTLRVSVGGPGEGAVVVEKAVTVVEG